MKEHEDLCLCFHVSTRQLRKHVRLEHPKRATQLSECYGAGSGCGWCIPFLEKVFEAETQGTELDLRMTREEYQSRRREYQQSRNQGSNSKGGGKPPHSKSRS